MDLLRRLMAVQHERGAVDDAALQRIARETGEPLYRLEGLRSFYPAFRERPGAPARIAVCRDVACRMKGAKGYARRLREVLSDVDAEVEEVSCLGLCDQAPACAVNDVSLSGAAEDIRDYSLGVSPLPLSPETPPNAPMPTDPHPGPEAHYATARALIGGSGAADARRDRVIQALRDSGLRGMGGAAFPTGDKWAYTRQAPGGPKTVVCNADESEPGTFKDRALLEWQPHLLVEGMIIAAWVIGAQRGIIYLRHEYERARRALEQAIAAAREAGALGGDVFGSGKGIEVEVFVSPGGYILGEETALLEALEDRRGEPRNKPPFPTVSGLDGRPTLINNVETLAAVPVIVERGADWWRRQGAGDYAGLKYVSLSGDVRRPGVYCVPWGTTVREVLELAGGVPGDRALKAFSPGGASTPFLPASALDTPLDFDAMREAGSGLGTGAILFVAEDRDLLDIVLAQTRFFRNESCGKCVPCRVGSHKAVQQIEAALAGEGEPGLDDHLETLNATLARTSICGLGQVALLPVVDALARFPDEPSFRVLTSKEAT